MSIITAAQAREFIDYNKDTGVLSWKKKPNRNIRVGDVAGGISHLGYARFHFLGKDYLGHRIAWLIMTGEFPINGIDHINGNRADNRWINLRDVPQLENGKNQKKRSTNTSGVMGVGWWKKKRRWVAYIKVSGVRIYLGLFTDIDSAATARKAAEKKYGFHENHGRIIN